MAINFIMQLLEQSSKWGNTENTMFVIGATKVQELKYIRKIIPDHFLLSTWYWCTKF